jgi:hypothetical protein
MKTDMATAILFFMVCIGFAEMSSQNDGVLGGCNGVLAPGLALWAKSLRRNS